MAKAAWDQAGGVWLGSFGVLDQVPQGLRPMGLGPWGWASHGGLWELSSLWLPVLFAWLRSWDGSSLRVPSPAMGCGASRGAGAKVCAGKKAKISYSCQCFRLGAVNHPDGNQSLLMHGCWGRRSGVGRDLVAL